MFESFVQSGLNFANGLINRSWQQSDTLNQREFARDAADTAYKRQRELYALQYQLSNPASVMTSLASAGINPNIAAGGSIGSIPSAPSVPQANTPALAPQYSYGLGMDNLLANSLSLQHMSNETDLTSAQVADLFAGRDLKVKSVELVTSQINDITQKIEESKARQNLIGYQSQSAQAKAAQDFIDLCVRQAYIDDEFQQKAREYDLSRQEYLYLIESMGLRLQGEKLANKKLELENDLSAEELKRVKAFNKYADDIYSAEKRSAIAGAMIDEITSDLLEDYGDAEKIISLLNDLTSGASGIMRLSGRSGRRLGRK